jgi:hypothetical protein
MVPRDIVLHLSPVFTASGKNDIPFPKHESLGLVNSLYLFLGYNEAGFNINLGFNVTIFGPLSLFPRVYSLKHLEHCPNWLGHSQP